MCMCVTKLRVKDGVCESDVSARQCRHFFASAAMSSALDASALRTWNGLNEVFHDLLCSMWCNEMCYVTAAPVLQPRIRRWWHRGKVPGRKSVEHECSWLSMQLWKTSTERMPVKSRHSHSGKHYGYDANCAFFPNMSTNHEFQKHWGVIDIQIGVGSRCICIRFFPNWVTACQSSCSRGHRLVDSLSGRATRACPPSKKLTGWVPEPVANTQRLHACYLVTTWQRQPMKSY